MPILTLVMGDPYGDGHGISEKVRLECNVGAAAVRKAYKIGSEKVGFDFCNDVAAEYEDSRIRLPELTKLREAGYKGGLDDEFDETKAREVAKSFEKYGADRDHAKWQHWAGGLLDEETYSDIYQFIVRLGNPKIKFKKAKRGEDLEIGGYGLFST